jgi:2,2-dialkylglycine decarboxylase (pyruvate)
MTGADMSDGATRHAELMAQARRHLIRYLGGEFPDILIERAAGAYVYDDRGRRILDFTSGQMCSTLGHNHPAVVDAIRRSSGRAFHLI